MSIARDLCDVTLHTNQLNTSRLTKSQQNLCPSEACQPFILHVFVIKFSQSRVWPATHTSALPWSGHPAHSDQALSRPCSLEGLYGLDVKS